MTSDIHEELVNSYYSAQYASGQGYAPMSCPVCDFKCSHKYIKRHLVDKHGWLYLENSEFPYPLPQEPTV